jgi:hypothetical protein
MKAGDQVMLVQAKGCQKWPENHQEAREKREPDFSSQPSPQKEIKPADLDLGLWPPDFETIYFCCVNHRSCVTL